MHRPGLRALLALLLPLSACRSTYGEQRRALAAWERGRAALEAGRPERAAGDFAEAARHDPASRLLPLWRARALREAGHPDEALEVLDRLLERGGAPPETLYERARCLLLLGREEEAREAARLLLDGRPELARRLEGDPLLGAFPELEPLPPPIEPRLHAPERVLLGERWELLVELSLPVEAGLHLDWEGEWGPLRLERVVEERDGEQRRLRLDLRACAAGELVLGPWRLEAGRSRGTLEARPLQVLAPPSAEPCAATPRPAAELWTPAALLSGWSGAGPARSLGDWLVLRAEPGEAEFLDGLRVGDAVRLELRRGGRVEERALAVPWQPGAARARLRLRGRELAFPRG